MLASLDLAVVPGKTVLEYGGRSFDNWLAVLKSMHNDVDIAAHTIVDDHFAVISARLADMGARDGGSVRLLNGVYKISSPVVFTSST